NESKKHLDNLFEQKSKQQQNLNEACINRENSLSNYYQATELLRFNNALEELNNKFKKESENIEKKHEKILEEIMSEDTISKYIKTVLSTNPSTDRYMCSESIPELVGLGEVSFDIARKSDLQPEVSQFILNGASKVIKEEYGKIVAKLPYCQILEDGISLFVNYSSSERANHQEELRNILLKLFMTFPPGKLEATMIDPLELGETFAMFTKLGEEQSRIIDTKIWSQEKDISECIYILRQKLETMTQAYGNDRATRLKKEPIRVLAITDFPTGFSQTALRDLQAIVRKSASFGVCVFIWANSEEVNKLAAKEQPILSEIKEKLQVATAKGRSLELESRKYKGVTLSIDKMDRARKNSSEIINTIAKGIHSSQNKIEKFVDMFDNIEDPNNWFGENSIQELAVPIGIKGANTIVKMTLGKTDGSTEHHALIAGQTGAGKSTLLHTIIMSTLLNYSPNEVQMYLVDFKEGVEFKSYTKYNLPSIKVIAIDSEREFGLNILKELCHELEVRADMFSRNGYEEISDYRKGTKNKVPKIMLIFDEVQELFRDRGNSDNITKECLQCLNKLITQGRAMGIHIILACQDFKLASAIQPLFSQMAIRIAIKGSEDSAKSVLGDNNAGAKQLQDRGPGAAIYNGHNGTESANVVFQVSYLEKEKRNEFLGKLNALQNHEALSKSGYGKTRILLTNAEDGRFNVFNELILNKKATKLVDNPKEYGIVIG
ncbi:MAG: FtsK/SpoIIIE domain-containing protein, partial [Clostridium sp.]